MTTEELISDLATRFDRVERAILGDESVGHVGLVTRMERQEETARLEERIHLDLEKSRVDGDRRGHYRIDKIDLENGDALALIEKKIDRTIWVSAGAFLGGIGIGTFTDLRSLLGGG